LSNSDYYSILGVQRDSSIEEIKAAYHKLALQFHPDKHTDNPLQKLAEERFKEIQEAYKTLSNARLRSRYDASISGHSANRPASYQPAAANSEDEEEDFASGAPSEDQIGKERKKLSFSFCSYVSGGLFGSAGIIYALSQVANYSENGYWTKRSVIDVAGQVIGSERLLIPWDWLFGLYRVVYRVLAALPFSLFLIMIGILIVMITMNRNRRLAE
jgi:curved DNA-binding protein CbpA